MKHRIGVQRHQNFMEYFEEGVSYRETQLRMQREGEEREEMDDEPMDTQEQKKPGTSSEKTVSETVAYYAGTYLEKKILCGKGQSCNQGAHPRNPHWSKKNEGNFYVFSLNNFFQFFRFGSPLNRNPTSENFIHRERDTIKIFKKKRNSSENFFSLT